MKSQESLRRVRRALATAVTAFVLLALLFPVYWAFVTSVLPASELVSRTPRLVPSLDSLTLDAYRELLSRPEVWTWFGNTVIVTFGAASLSMVISAAAGYSLSSIPTRGRDAMGVSLLFGRMLPGTLLVIPIYLMFSSIGVTDSLLGLIVMNCTAIVPFSAWMMKSFFDSIPRELEESAMVDGTSKLGAFIRIVLPLSRAGLAATAIFSALVAWGDYLFVRTLSHDPSKWTLTVGMRSFQGEYGIDWNGVMALGVLSIVPIAVLFILLEPYLVKGITAGAVTG